MKFTKPRIFFTELAENFKTYTKNQLFRFIKESEECSIEGKITYLENHLLITTHCPPEKVSCLKRELRFFKTEFKHKWLAASRKEDRFLKTNEKWLAETVTLTVWLKRKSGRPLKEFEECSSSSKRRKTKELRQVPDNTLMYAAQMSLRASGKSDASAILKEISKSPQRASKVRKVLSTSHDKIHPLTTKQALSVFVEAG